MSKYVNVVSLMLMLLIVVARWGTVGIVTGVVVLWLSALDLNICIIFGMELCPNSGQPDLLFL